MRARILLWDTPQTQPLQLLKNLPTNPHLQSFPQHIKGLRRNLVSKHFSLRNITTKRIDEIFKYMPSHVIPCIIFSCVIKISICLELIFVYIFNCTWSMFCDLYSYFSLFLVHFLRNFKSLHKFPPFFSLLRVKKYKFLFLPLGKNNQKDKNKTSG